MTIFVALKGGLGNQLFQYSAGRCISDRLDVDLALDTSWFRSIKKRDTPRLVELPKLGLDCKLTDYSPWLPKLSSRLDAIHNLISSKIIVREIPHTYNSNFFNICDNSFLFGYWQSYLYSESIHKKLCSEIYTSINRLSSSSANFLSQIRCFNSDSVSVHVRRGDYVSLAAANAYHGVLPLRYYENCFSRVCKVIQNPAFFVFSDDIDWCKLAFSGYSGNFLFIDCNKQHNSWQDMILMSLCSHHILANSSFSWWSARLGDYKSLSNNIVLYPFHWSTSNDTNDLTFMFPPHWISVNF